MSVLLHPRDPNGYRKTEKFFREYEPLLADLLLRPNPLNWEWPACRAPATEKVNLYFAVNCCLDNPAWETSVDRVKLENFRRNFTFYVPPGTKTIAVKTKYTRGNMPSLGRTVISRVNTEAQRILRLHLDVNNIEHVTVAFKSLQLQIQIEPISLHGSLPAWFPEFKAKHDPENFILVDQQEHPETGLPITVLC